MIWRMPRASCVVKAVLLSDTEALVMLGNEMTKFLRLNLTSGEFTPFNDMPIPGVGSALSPPASFGDVFVVGPPIIRTLRNVVLPPAPTPAPPPSPILPRMPTSPAQQEAPVLSAPEHSSGAVANSGA